MTMTNLDQSQVIRTVYDADNQALRTTATVEVPVGGTEVVIDEATDSIRTVPYRGTLTNRGGATSGTPSTSTQVCAANTSRKYFVIQNLSTSDYLYVNFGSAASTGTDSVRLNPGGSYSMEGGFVSTEAVNVLATVASVNYFAKEG